MRFWRSSFERVHGGVAAVACLLAAGITLPRGALAEGEAGRPARPVVLLITTGDTAADRERERRFAAELALNTETLAVDQVPGTEGFLAMSLDRQLGHVEPLIARRGAVAALWLNATEENLLLQVVVSDVGRSLVRLFRHELAPDAEVALAVTAAGLLETTYAFASEDGAPGSDDVPHDHPSRAAVAPTVNEPPDAAPDPKTASPSPWHLLVSLLQGGPVTGHQGPGLDTGGAITAERELSAPLRVSVGAGGSFGPYGESSSPIRRGWRIWGEAGLAALFGGGVRGGPMISVDGSVNGTVVEDAPAPRRTLTFWNLRGRAGGELRVTVLEKRWVSFSAGLAAQPRVIIRRKADGEVLGKTAVAGWWLRVGMGVF